MLIRDIGYTGEVCKKLYTQSFKANDWVFNVSNMHNLLISRSFLTLFLVGSAFVPSGFQLPPHPEFATILSDSEGGGAICVCISHTHSLSYECVIS